MLELEKIKKDYVMGDTTVHALRGVSLKFRRSEFVSILGQSGCGKTTLLNIIGGLDRYTTGDLTINGISTKKYTSHDWDIYRNNSIGFVFQTYNLITHQNVLMNVELALTVSGVSKEERRKRAKEALKEVGLEDQMYKKPNQLSGGQMQRVAIARALVNKPDIILADEPTGALDSVTSIQTIDLLKKISQDKLVIMVTHNSELANKYSSRIVKLSDGEIISDSNPYDPKKDSDEVKKEPRDVSMSFKTALGLSFSNLLTKKGRTIITAFAGSIGIIGIALILALSNGIQKYIDRIEEDTLSSYPLMIEETTMDMTSMMSSLMELSKENEEVKNSDKIFSKDIMLDLMDSVSNEVQKNNLEAFKKFLESDNKAKDSINAIQYIYGIDLNIYKKQPDKNEYLLVNPSQVMNSLGMGQMMEAHSSMSSMSGMMSMTGSSMDIWKELLDNKNLLKTQYDILKGRLPEKYNEVVLIVNKDNTISDYTLYTLGIRDQSELAQKIMAMQKGEKTEFNNKNVFTYDELLNLEFKLVLNTDYYTKQNNIWLDKRNDASYMDTVFASAETIKIVGIIRPNEESVISSMSPGQIGYLKDLKDYVINKVNDSKIAKEQKSNPQINIFTGGEFIGETGSFDYSDLTDEQKAYIASLSESELANFIATYSLNANNTYESNLSALGVVDLNKPSAIYIYPTDFDGKETIADAISEYNEAKRNEGNEEDVINYTDIVGLMMSSVSSIVNIISYVLIAFVAISLIVSSIMIGIITYISVLERTKEIGILRSIGASKRDISNVFNAETFIIGLSAGFLGIIVTALLIIPGNMIIKNVTNVSNLAKLPAQGAIILVIISMLLTMLAGLIPSKMAAKKDPVVALRTE